MSAFKEYTMMFQLNAKLGGSYSKAFKQAMQELESMQKEIQELSKMQADISAFQKQQAAAEATRKRLEMLMQQYDNIQREMEETGNESADMKNKLLAKQLQIDKTSASLEKQTAKLNELSGALEEAGVNTDDLSHSSEQLAGKIDTLKKKQGEAADKAMTFGDKAGQAFNQVHEAIVAAGMHDPRHRGGKGQARLLLNGKRVNIRPQGQHRTGLDPFQHRYHACFGGKFQCQTRDFFQFLRQVSRCMDLLKGELRILMHVAPPGDYIRLQRQDLF